jgi:hypothetical protein
MTAKKWIQKALDKPGSKGKLHRELHVKMGKKIPEKKMERAEHSENPRMRKQVNLARTLRGLRK